MKYLFWIIILNDNRFLLDLFSSCRSLITRHSCNRPLLYCTAALIRTSGRYIFRPNTFRSLSWRWWPLVSRGQGFLMWEKGVPATYSYVLTGVLDSGNASFRLIFFLHKIGDSDHVRLAAFRPNPVRVRLMCDCVYIRCLSDIGRVLLFSILISHNNKKASNRPSIQNPYLRKEVKVFLGLG